MWQLGRETHRVPHYLLNLECEFQPTSYIQKVKLRMRHAVEPRSMP